MYICRALYLRIPLPSPPWGRGWIAPGAFISRGETGEGVLIRASYPNASGNDHTASEIFCTNISGPSWTMPFDTDARPSWFPPCPRLLTPSPPRQAERGAPFSPRLMTTPLARHPLPQGGEGKEFTRTGHDHRNYPPAPTLSFPCFENVETQGGGLRPPSGLSTFVGRSISEFLCPRPLGGEGGSHPAPSSAGARRVRGSSPSVLSKRLR